MNKYIAHSIKPTLLIIISLWSIINLYCLNKYDCFLTNDFIKIIRETNPDEAKEYFSTFFSWTDYLLIILLITVCIGFYITISRIRIKKYPQRWIPACFLLFISILSICHNPSIINEYLLSNTLRWEFKFNTAIDLTRHQTSPHIINSDSLHPNSIVVIIGESFSRNHSSLYGYSKETNPLLKEGIGKTIFLFDKVLSPRAYTTQAFKYLLNTYQLGNEKKTWYDTTNIIEVLRNSGYNTFWISNQYNNKVYGSIPFAYSKLSNQSHFMAKDTKGHKYDGALINYRIKGNTNSFNFIIYHLMGQHEAFKERYPADFSHFKASDYMQYPKHQREILAAYDNATLYNDYVVYNIIDNYKDKDAVVFYFSDHGLDLFDTDPNFFGHAKATAASTEHCREIPFIVYLSPRFQDQRPALTEKIKNAAHKDFCTDKLIYAIMDVAGYRFADNNDVEKYSLFSK